jgi:hypothetical protein
MSPKILPGSWDNQRLHKLRPGSSCNVTSAVVALEASGVRSPQVPMGMLVEDYMTMIVDGAEGIEAMRKICPWFFADKKGGGEPSIPPGEAPLMLDWIVQRVYGKPYLKYTETLTLQRCLAEIDAERAVVLRTILVPDGHLVAMVGYTADDEPGGPRGVTGVVVRDSWGNFNSGYEDQNGNNVVLSLLTFANHVRVPGQPMKAGHVLAQEVLYADRN